MDERSPSKVIDISDKAVTYGIVFLIDVESGYRIDYEILSLYCEICTMKKTHMFRYQFNKRFRKHKRHCNKNYNGTSKSIEKEGTIRLFQRSLVNGLRYKVMVCDGESAGYEAIKYYYVQQHERHSDQEEDELSTSLVMHQ